MSTKKIKQTRKIDTMSDDQIVEAMKENLVRNNLSNFCGKLVDAVEEEHGSFESGSRKYWHGLVLGLVVDCAHELSEAYNESIGMDDKNFECKN